MFLTDLKDQRWKVTLDENETVYFYVQDMIGTTPKLEIPASELAGYYALAAEEKTVFEKELGRKIGIPFWPLFVERIIEPEQAYIHKLGLYGRTENEELCPEDVFQLIVPMPKDAALAQNPELVPDEETCRAHEAYAAMEKQNICASAITAMYCPIFKEDEYKTSVYVTKAQLDIDCCVVCNSPAVSVGAYPDEDENSGRVILHGLCKRCKPTNVNNLEQIQKIREAITSQVKAHRIPCIECGEIPEEE